MRYISAHYVFPVSSPPLKNGIVCVGDDGCIIDVIDTGGKLIEREKLEFYNGILVPGFVNAHCHLELSHLRDTVQPHSGLPEFISAIGKQRRSDFDAAKEADREMTRNGIVAVADISNSADTISLKKDSNIMYHTFVELFGLDGNRAKTIFAAGLQLMEKFTNAGLDASLTPHAIYSVSRELWEEFNKSCPSVVSIHHRESSEEMNIFFEGKGKLAEALRKSGALTDNNKTSKDVVQKMVSFLQQSSKCLLVHNTFSTREDLITACNFHYVLCPCSNLFIQNCLPDLLLFSNCQNVCLGTDSLASNTSLSILEEMKIIHQHAPYISLNTLIRWATLNGARALGFDSSLGSFEKGKSPGVNLIAEIDFDNMRLTARSAVKVL